MDFEKNTSSHDGRYYGVKLMENKSMKGRMQLLNFNEAIVN